MSKITDPLPKTPHECQKCGQVLQPLANGIPHWCDRPGVTSRILDTKGSNGQNNEQKGRIKMKLCKDFTWCDTTSRRNP